MAFSFPCSLAEKVATLKGPFFSLICNTLHTLLYYRFILLYSCKIESEIYAID